MVDPTNAERQRRWRERQAGRIAPAAKVPCTGCGIIHTGAHGTLCRLCWRKTPDGLEWQRQRTAAFRAKRRSNPPVTTDEPST